MRAIGIMSAFLLAVAAGALLAPGRGDPLPERAPRTWQESRDLHIEKHAEGITRKVASRLLSEARVRDPDRFREVDPSAIMERYLEEWTRVYSDAYSAFHPGTELLQAVLQEEYGHLTPEEFSPIAAALMENSTGDEKWPTSVVVGGERRVFVVDLRDYASLFEDRGFGIRPEGELEARIRSDLESELLRTAIVEGERESR